MIAILKFSLWSQDSQLKTATNCSLQFYLTIRSYNVVKLILVTSNLKKLYICILMHTEMAFGKANSCCSKPVYSILELV